MPDGGFQSKRTCCVMRNRKIMMLMLMLYLTCLQFTTATKLTHVRLRDSHLVDASRLKLTLAHRLYAHSGCQLGKRCWSCDPVQPAEALQVAQAARETWICVA